MSSQLCVKGDPSFPAGRKEEAEDGSLLPCMAPLKQLVGIFLTACVMAMQRQTGKRTRQAKVLFCVWKKSGVLHLLWKENMAGTAPDI